MKEESGKIKLILTGRIDSTNASAVEAELLSEMDAQKGKEIVIEADGLEYISSAGLRVLMKIRKSSGKPLEILDVSRDVYDIFEMTGFTELFDVKKAYRSINTDDFEVIGKGFFGTVYRMDNDSIVKVYRGADKLPMIENEIKTAKKAFVSGIPTAIAYDIVKVGEDYGSVFEMINARTFHELLQDGEIPFDDIVKRYVTFLKQIHGTELEAGTFPSYREIYLKYLEVIRKHLIDEQYEGLKKLLTLMEDECTVVHGDVQMKNVMMSDDEPLLIDMDTLGLGNPVFDFAGLCVTYRLFEEDDPDNSMAFLGITGETVEKLWSGIIDYYFEFEDDEQRKQVLDRIALVASIRFLYLLESTDLKESELGRKRLAHTREHIGELLRTVTKLSV